MNSKIEYSRTIIPSIKIKMGNKSEKEDPDIVKEKLAVEKIKDLRKMNRKREKSDEKLSEIMENSPDSPENQTSNKRIKLMNDNPLFSVKPTVNQHVIKSDPSNFTTVDCSKTIPKIIPNIVQLSDPSNFTTEDRSR